MSDSAKVAFKFGKRSVEYEGPIDFVRDGLLQLCENMVGFATDETADVDDDLQDHASVSASAERSNGNNLAGLTVNAIANKLGCAKGVDLFKAAAASLSLVQGRETFSKADIVNEAKKATSFYKQSTHGKNSGSLIEAMTKEDFLREQGADRYALAAPAIAEMRSRLGG